jgi:hypothetical protein
VALNGFGPVEDHRRTAGTGFDHHLTNPMDLDAQFDLLARVQWSSMGRNCPGNGN